MLSELAMREIATSLVSRCLLESVLGQDPNNVSFLVNYGGPTHSPRERLDEPQQRPPLNVVRGNRVNSCFGRRERWEVPGNLRKSQEKHLLWRLDDPDTNRENKLVREVKGRDAH
jgi:hypothetical protein